MATPLGTNFSTDENVVAQVDLRLLGLTVESFVVEFNQENFEKLLFSGSISPKVTRQYQSLFGDSLSSLFRDFSKSDPRTCSQSKQCHFQRGSESLLWSPRSSPQCLSRDLWGQCISSQSKWWWRSISLSLSSQTSATPGCRGFPTAPVTQSECWKLT